MANTKSSTKRARQADARRDRNQIAKSAVKTSVRNAFTAAHGKDAKLIKEAYDSAVRALSKAASRGTIPKARAARKIKRMTHLIKKTLPAALTQPGKAKA